MSGPHTQVQPGVSDHRVGVLELDTGFRPSAHGFGFANAWHDTLFGVLPSRGRCGGMVFLALDHFLAGVALPEEAVASSMPPHDSALARRVLFRQVDSVLAQRGLNTALFAGYTYLPADAPGGVGNATRNSMLPMFDALAAGHPVPLGLVSGFGLTQLPGNHQVLAYAASFRDEGVGVRIYDPNLPRRDDVTLEVTFGPAAPVPEHVGESAHAAGRPHRIWRGLFVERYAPESPRAL